VAKGLSKAGFLDDTLWVVVLCVALGVCLVSIGRAHTRYAAAEREHRRVQQQIEALRKKQGALRAQKKALQDGSPLLYERLGHDLLNLRRKGTVRGKDVR
jgi:cell division protein FtsB